MSEPASIRPFRALRYNLKQIDKLAELIAPPYDVISPQQQKELYAKSPHNIAWLDVTQEGTDTPSAERYQKAASDFRRWQDEGILERDEAAGLYVYEQKFSAPDGQTFVRRGFYGLRRLEPFGEGRVFPHERTLSGPKKDRLSLMKATAAQMSPIFGLYRDPAGRVAPLLKEAVLQSPLFEIQDDSNQTHRLWHVSDPAWIEKLQAAVQESPFLIADGHHRYETALAYSQQHPDTSPYVLMFCEEMDDPGLLVLPTHRLAQNRPNFSKEDFLNRLRERFAVKELPNADAEKCLSAIQNHNKEGHCFGFAFRGDTTRYIATIATENLASVPALQNVPEPLRSLDAAIAHKCFLEDFLGYTEQDQENPNYIAYLKSGAELFERIDQEPSQVGILMNAAPLPQIREIAEAGQFMPPKTTYFYPKLPTGLVIHLID